MKFKVVSIFQLEEDIKPTLVRYKISLSIDSKTPCYEHNHTMDFMDRLKINSYIVGLAGRLVVQGHAPADVFCLLRNTKITADKDLLTATTNTVESWHYSLKTHARSSHKLAGWSLLGITLYTYHIADQWEDRVEDIAI